MKANHVFGNYKKQLYRLKKLARMAKKDPAIDIIHRLRTRIKRLRAFYRWLKYLDPEFPYKKVMKPWKTLYRFYGPKRDKQVMQTIANHYHVQASHQPDHTEFSDNPDKPAHIIRFSEKVVKKSLLQKHRKNPGSYFNTGWQKIKNFVEQPEIERIENIHQLRKILKDQNYNLLYRSKKNLKPLQPVIKWMGEMEEAIGRYLDINLVITSNKYADLFNGKNTTTTDAEYSIFDAKKDQMARINNLLERAITLFQKMI